MQQQRDNNENSNCSANSQTFPSQPAEERRSMKMWSGSKNGCSPLSSVHPLSDRCGWVRAALPPDKSSARTKVSGACLLGPLTLPQLVLFAANKPAEVTNSSSSKSRPLTEFPGPGLPTGGGEIAITGLFFDKNANLKNLNSWRALWRVGS